MKLENEHRYLVSIGTFRGEQAAIARRKCALDAGLRAEIIDTQDDTQTNMIAALLLIAEQLEKLTGNKPIAEPKAEPKPIVKPEKSEEEKQKEAEAFADRIIVARKQRKLSQEELALIAGVSKTTVARAEWGDANLKKDTRDAILKALKIKGGSNE